MDPWTLHKLAGHRDMSITKRFVDPQDDTIRSAIERARTTQVGISGGVVFARRYIGFVKPRVAEFESPTIN